MERWRCPKLRRQASACGTLHQLYHHSQRESRRSAHAAISHTANLFWPTHKPVRGKRLHSGNCRYRLASRASASKRTGFRNRTWVSDRLVERWAFGVAAWEWYDGRVAPCATRQLDHTNLKFFCELETRFGAAMPTCRALRVHCAESGRSSRCENCMEVSKHARLMGSSTRRS